MRSPLVVSKRVGLEFWKDQLFLHRDSSIADSIQATSREICLHKVAWNVMQQGAEIVGGPEIGGNQTAEEPMLTVVTET